MPFGIGQLLPLLIREDTDSENLEGTFCVVGPLASDLTATLVVAPPQLFVLAAAVAEDFDDDDGGALGAAVGGRGLGGLGGRAGIDRAVRAVSTTLLLVGSWPGTESSAPIPASVTRPAGLTRQ
ncbi:MAG: hypothetical protein HXX10_26470 [Rhodoplanes sp.]|uniref:hypothetical protein n=1 Tax=Rhodoplanes sp. TaxID=1968906 RepID=UPI00180D4036|nr:hypothetical protein [Rhodoplanes sp.]NVO17589.1 hypothetical protein [Rhodoplanes sp.]